MTGTWHSKRHRKTFAPRIFLQMQKYSKVTKPRRERCKEVWYEMWCLKCFKMTWLCCILYLDVLLGVFCVAFCWRRFVGLWLCSCASTGLSALVVLRGPATWHRTHEALSDLADGRCRHCTGRVRQIVFLQTRHVFEIRCISAFFVVRVFFFLSKVKIEDVLHDVLSWNKSTKINSPLTYDFVDTRRSIISMLPSLLYGRPWYKMPTAALSWELGLSMLEASKQVFRAVNCDQVLHWWYMIDLDHWYYIMKRHAM